MFIYIFIDPEIYYKLTDTSNRDISIQVYGAFSCPSVLRSLIEEVRHGFLAGLSPTLIPDGTSGTYNLRNTNKEVVALFKPIDEEAFAPNNQKGFAGKFGQETFRNGILSGEGSIREVAAYLIDKNNYFGVPETTFVEIAHPSFNKTTNALCTIEDDSFHKFRNSIIHNYVRENVVEIKDSLSSIENTDNMENNADCAIRKKYGSFQRFVKSTDVAANFANTLYDAK